MHHTSQIGSAEADEARKNGSCTNHSVWNSEICLIQINMVSILGAKIQISYGLKNQKFICHNGILAWKFKLHNISKWDYYIGFQPMWF